MYLTTFNYAKPNYCFKIFWNWKMFLTVVFWGDEGGIKFKNHFIKGIKKYFYCISFMLV